MKSLFNLNTDSFGCVLSPNSIGLHCFVPMAGTDLRQITFDE